MPVKYCSAVAGLFVLASRCTFSFLCVSSAQVQWPMAVQPHDILLSLCSQELRSSEDLA